MAPNNKTTGSSRAAEASNAGLAATPQPMRHESGLSRIVSDIDEADATDRYQLEADDNKPSTLPNSRSSSVSDQKLVHWEDGDPENPYNFSTKRKVCIVLIGMLSVLNSTVGSALPSNALPEIIPYFHVESATQEVLPISMYLIGYVLGPLLFGPLSEQFGRSMIMKSSFFAYTAFTMACALAPDWASFLVFRLLCGIMASSPNTIVGGIYADIYDDPITRGRAMSIFIGGTIVGPLISPVISGFISPAMGWRWTFWIGLIIAGASWPPLLCLPETYGPVLLMRRAAKLRRSTGNPNIFAPFELEKKGFKQMATVTLTRPLRMLFFEFIVLATCLYLSLAYAIFYMYFEAYPIIFQGVYHQSAGVSGLMFLPIATGAFLGPLIFLYYDSALQKARALNKPWTQKEEFRRLPLACIGGPLYVISLFWMGWTARVSIPFYVPMLAGIPFGVGFVLIFMALLNYLTDAYEVFAASSMAAASTCRSIFGAVLPFATKPMYNRLGIPWASSLLGCLSLVMCGIPFMFLWKGDLLRERSKFCRFLKEKRLKEEEELKAERTKRDSRRLLEQSTAEVFSEKV